MNTGLKMKKAGTLEPATALIPACLRGDTKAKETLARWCLPKVRRTVLLTYGTGPDADDIVQVTMARVFSRMDTYRGDSLFYTWVDRITVNAVRDHFRTGKVRRRHIDDRPIENDPRAPEPTPETRLSSRRMMESLAAHFAWMKEEQRIPLALSLAYGYTADEISSMLDLNMETVKKRLQRGRSALIKRIKKDPRLKDAVIGLGR